MPKKVWRFKIEPLTKSTEEPCLLCGREKVRQGLSVVWNGGYMSGAYCKACVRMFVKAAKKGSLA